jgi:hypothetical protein
VELFWGVLYCKRVQCLSALQGQDANGPFFQIQHAAWSPLPGPSRYQLYKFHHQEQGEPLCLQPLDLYVRLAVIEWMWLLNCTCTNDVAHPSLRRSRFLRLQIDLVAGMMDCLYAECIPCITDCVIAELEKLGQKYRVALKVAKARAQTHILEPYGRCMPHCLS